MTVANFITTIRIILAPVFVIYLIDDRFLSALVVFVICGVSDGADGLVARLYNQKSRIGTILDPLADKMILVAAFVVSGVRGLLPSWLPVLVISRDVLILLGVLVLYLTGLKFTLRPSLLSKATTCLQFITVIAVLAREFLTLPGGFFAGLFILTGALTVSSGLHYMTLWFRFMGEGAGNRDMRRSRGPTRPSRYPRTSSSRGSTAEMSRPAQNAGPSPLSMRARTPAASASS